MQPNPANNNQTPQKKDKNWRINYHLWVQQ